MKPLGGTILRRTGTLAAAALALAGCAHPRGPVVVTDPDPSVKIPATERAVQRRDLSAVPQLIKDLQSDDAAVRLYAIHALHELTGQKFGYHYYDPDEAREAAAQRWKTWFEEQNDLASGRVKSSTTAATQTP